MDNETDFNGRKIFFLHPHPIVQNGILSSLCMAEYEVYTAYNHNALRRVLKHFPNSIVFVNIDEELTEKQWAAWITDCMSDPDMAGVDIGVLTTDRSKELKEKYTAHIKVAAGATLVTMDLTRLCVQLIEILKQKDALGRRKYLRAQLPDKNGIIINIPYNGAFLDGAIRDISSAGFSCFFHSDPLLDKGDILSDMLIKLHGSPLRAEGVVYGTRFDEASKIYVSVFTPNTDPHTRGKIRAYIQSVIQAKMDEELHRAAAAGGE